jgi:NAD(P)-dependent dehydrogenase (short-subunit alcohol dehydrogenase family)
MQNSYTNKIVLVTGGTSVSEKLRRWPLQKRARKSSSPAAVKRKARMSPRRSPRRGGTAAFVRADVAKDADVAKAIDFVVSTHGRLDVAFNNAGVEITGPLNQVTEEQYGRPRCRSRAPSAKNIA